MGSTVVSCTSQAPTHDQYAAGLRVIKSLWKPHSEKSSDGIPMPFRDQSRPFPTIKILNKMKNLKYVLVFVLGLMAMSCTEELVHPHHENDPVTTPPPPPKP
jgi:hypothetical protein